MWLACFYRTKVKTQRFLTESSTLDDDILNYHKLHCFYCIPENSYLFVAYIIIFPTPTFYIKVYVCQLYLRYL